MNRQMQAKGEWGKASEVHRKIQKIRFKNYKRFLYLAIIRTYLVVLIGSVFKT